MTSVGRNGRLIHHSDEGHDADIIHNRLLDLLDPAKHMHPGKPSAPRILNSVRNSYLSGILISILADVILKTYIMHPGKQNLVCSKNSELNSHHNS